MEKEKMKRARERDDDETEPRSLENNSINYNAKKRDLHGINLVKENQQQKDVVESEKASLKPWDSHLALGVFDFPWLNDGVMSKTEDHFLEDFEDKFSSSLEQQHHQDGIHYFSESYCYCETPAETSKMVMETVWQPLESDDLEIKAEDVDCIWSSLVSKNNHSEGKILM